MKRYTDQAIVLKRVDYAEADRIVQVITRENGKRSLMARGVRRAKSKLAGGIELFSVSSITAIVGKGDIEWVAKQIMTHGGREGWETGAKLCR